MLTVLKPGLLTTVQDQGRTGYQRHGIVVGGAVDAFAARVANLVVGNDGGAAVLELAFTGPELRAMADVLVALCGADFEFKVGGKEAPRDRPVAVRQGEVLTFGPARAGARACLAVAGGIDVPAVLGSRSTYVRGRLGGFEGRPLVAGDVVKCGRPTDWAARQWQSLIATPLRSATWSVRPETLGRVSVGSTVRAVRGPEWDHFDVEAQHTVFGADYTVTKDIDRMGMRLSGPPLMLKQPREEISSAVNVGVVQVPASGQPIVLLVGRQSVGGYARIAAVASVDLGKLAQLRPGESVKFKETTLARAHELLLAREKDFTRVQSGLTRMTG